MKTVKQAAAEWDVTPACVYTWLKKGYVQGINLGERATMIVTADRPKPKPSGRPRRPA